MKSILHFKFLKGRYTFLCLALFLLGAFNESIAQTPVLVHDNKKFMNDGQNIAPISPSERWIHGKVMAADKKAEVLGGTTNALNDCGNIAFDSDNIRNCVTTGMITVNYDGFTPEAQDAFQYAVDIWSKVLNLPVPIEINANFAPLAPGVLGQAGPDAFYNLGGIIFPSSLADQLVGFDIDGSDMSMTFSSTFPFLFRLGWLP